MTRNLRDSGRTCPRHIMPEQRSPCTSTTAGPEPTSSKKIATPWLFANDIAAAPRARHLFYLDLQHATRFNRLVGGEHLLSSRSHGFSHVGSCGQFAEHEVRDIGAGDT